MAYLAKSDYTISIAIDHLDEILEQASSSSGLTATNVLNNAEAWGRAFVTSYLTSKYNIAQEFATNSPGGNPLVKQILVELILCQLHKTINPRDIPELREKACEAAVQWLKDARDGTVVVDLPGQTPPTGEPLFNRTHIGSQVKFISKPYSDRSVVGEDAEI